MGGAAAVGQGRHDEVGAVDVVAAREDPREARPARDAVDENQSGAVELEPKVGLAQHGIGRVANRYHRRLTRYLELGARDWDRAAAAALVGLAELHALALQRSQMALLIGQESQGNRQVEELDALFVR